MSEEIKSLESMDELTREGITFNMYGYESITGQWVLEFSSFDGVSCLLNLKVNGVGKGFTNEFNVYADTFIEDIETAIKTFKKYYNFYLEIQKEGE